MENASKALIIAGAILLSILIIAIGMYIYTSSHNSISEAGSQISEQEKTSFNQQWNTFEGAQGGNNIKALLQKVISNCNTNAEEEQRLVNVYCSRAKASENNGTWFYYVFDINMSTKYGDKKKMGTILECRKEGKPTFVLMFICEGNFRPDLKNDYLSYESLEKCMK